MAKIHKVLDWAKETGNERVISRINLMSLSVLMKEKIDLEEVDASTEVSEETYQKIKEAAETVTKQKCPY